MTAQDPHVPLSPCHKQLAFQIQIFCVLTNKKASCLIRKVNKLFSSRHGLTFCAGLMENKVRGGRSGFFTRRRSSAAKPPNHDAASVSSRRFRFLPHEQTSSRRRRARRRGRTTHARILVGVTCSMHWLAAQRGVNGELQVGTLRLFPCSPCLTWRVVWCAPYSESCPRLTQGCVPKPHVRPLLLGNTFSPVVERHVPTGHTVPGAGSTARGSSYAAPPGAARRSAAFGVSPRPGGAVRNRRVP